MNTEWNETAELLAFGLLEPRQTECFRDTLRGNDEAKTCAAQSFELMAAYTAATVETRTPCGRVRRDVLSHALWQGAWPENGSERTVSFVAMADDLMPSDWYPGRTPGVALHLLHGDALKGGLLFLRVDPGTIFPSHRHVGAEDMLVLQGGFTDRDGAHRAGRFISNKPDSLHLDLRAMDDATCVLLVRHHGLDFECLSFARRDDY